MEPSRRLVDYVRLPAERYNVLDSKAVQRVGENEFRVSTGPQKFLFFDAEPTGLIRIEVLADGVAQRLLKAELRSSKPNKVIDEINKTLGGLQLTNRVTSGAAADGSTQLQCQLVLEGNFTYGVMSKVSEPRLNGMMAWALRLAMPWFLTKLREDYRRWAAGLDRRMAVGNGEMQALAAQAAKGGAAALPSGVEELPLVGTDAASAEIEPPEEEASAKPKGFGGATRT